MPRVTRRSRQQRRQSVLEAAAERVRSAQLDWASALTFGALARQTGIDQGQIARDFGSKESLAVELARFLLDPDGHRQNTEEVEVFTEGILEEEMTLADAVARWARDNDPGDYDQLRAQMMLWAAAGPESPEWNQLDQLFTGAVDAYADGIDAVVDRAVAKGAIRRDQLNATEVILVMSAVIEGLRIRSAVVPGLVPDGLNGRVLLALVAAMVGPDGAGPVEQLGQVHLGPIPTVDEAG